MAPPGPDSDTAKELAAKHGGALTGLTGDAGGDPRFRGRRRIRLDFSRPWQLPRDPLMVGVAQLVERRVVVADVAGSSPVTHPSTRQPRPGERFRAGLPRQRGDAVKATSRRSRQSLTDQWAGMWPNRPFWKSS